jgi:hypothetical protein
LDSCAEFFLIRLKLINFDQRQLEKPFLDNKEFGQKSIPSFGPY